MSDVRVNGWTRESVMRSIRSFHARHGKWPNTVHINSSRKFNLPTFGTIQQLFGSIEAALASVGAVLPRRGRGLVRRGPYAAYTERLRAFGLDE